MHAQLAPPLEADQQEAQPASTEPALAEPLYRRVPEHLLGQQQVPLATYRVQLHKDFTFAGRSAIGALPGAPGRQRPLRLAVSSRPRRAAPTATTWSTTPRLNPELGARPRASPRSPARPCAATGMGLVLDVVPNHMGIERAQPALWIDVLENGPASLFARFFDIDWEPVKAELRGQGAAADPGGSVRRGAGAGRAPARRTGDGGLLRPLLRPRAAGRPRAVPRRARATSWSSWRSAGRRAPRRSSSCSRILTALRHLPSPHGDRAGRRSSSAAGRRRSSSGGWRAVVDGERRRGRATSSANVERLQRHAGRPAQLRPARRAARAAAATGSPTGGWPGRRSTTGASSTSTGWRRSAWRTPRSSTRRTRSSSSWLARGQGHRAAHRPPRRALRSHRLLPPAAGALLPRAGAARSSSGAAADEAQLAGASSRGCCARSGGRRSARRSRLAAAPARSTWWWRRSWAAGSASPTPGRCTAPPATASPTSSAGCFVDPAAGRGAHRDLRALHRRSRRRLRAAASTRRRS